MTSKLFSATFRCDNLHYQVRSPAVSHLAWLSAFLSPHFVRKKAAARPIRIDLTIDPSRFRQLHARLDGAGTVPGFMYDSRVLHLPCFRDPGGKMILYEAPYRVFYEVSENRRHVVVVIDKDNVNVRTPLMRVIREYAVNNAQLRGDFFMHASCFKVKGRTVVVAGAKKAGKTTLLLFACRTGGVQYVSNDRVRVRTLHRGYTLRSVPVIITIRKGSFDFFPDIGQALLRRRLHHRLSGKEHPDRTKPRQAIGQGGTYDLSTLQFCDLMGIRAAAEATEPLVVIPRLTHAAGTFAIRRLRPAEAFGHMQDSLFGAKYWAVSTPIFNLEPDTPADAALLKIRCRRFAAQVPVLACDIGRDLYGMPGGARTWIAALLQAAD